MTPQTPRLGHLSPRPERRDGDPAAATAWIAGLLDVLGAAHAGAKWQCPAHDGNSPALALHAGDRGAVLYCHAGCDTADVLATLGLRRGHLFAPPDPPPGLWAQARCSHVSLPPMSVVSSPQAAGYRHECFHDYGDRHRKERLRHPTSGRKEVRWEHRGAGGEWNPGLLDTRESELPLYRERDLALAIGAGEPILLVESESSVDALVKAGIYATTWAGGAASPPLETLRRVLGDYDRVVFVADADDAGRHCAETLHTLGIVNHVLPGDAAGGTEGDDARDLLHRLGAAGLLALVARAFAAPPGAPPLIADTEADAGQTGARSANAAPDATHRRDAAPDATHRREGMGTATRTIARPDTESDTDTAGPDVTRSNIRSDTDDVETRVRAEVLPNLPTGSVVAYEPERDHLHLYWPGRDHPPPADDSKRYLSRSVHPAATATAWRWDAHTRRWIRRDLDPTPTWLRTLARGAGS